MIGVRHLGFRYHPEESALFQDLSHQFPGGSLTMIGGPSGTGKSTLLYILGLMLTPTNGAVTWSGQDVSSFSDGDRSRLRAAMIGFVFQDAALNASRTVLSNIVEGALYAGIGIRQARHRAMELMDRFGVEVDPGRQPGEVSGGQAQRIALCRALVKEPTVILADEPTGNLDDSSGDVVWGALSDAAQSGSTVVAATHDERRWSLGSGLVVLD